MELFWYPVLLLIGCLIGVVTGLIPGLHVNVVAGIMVGVAGALIGLGIPPLAISVFIVGVAVVHAFLDVIPSLFLGIPANESYALLPGHRMVREGRGKEAILVSNLGSWYGIALGLFVLSLLLGLREIYELNLATNMHDLLKKERYGGPPLLFWILFVISIILIVSDRHFMRALLIFVTSGLFGLLIFATPLVPGGTNAAFSLLFPALSGLFGVSGLIIALKDLGADRTMPIESPEAESNISLEGYGKVGIFGAMGGMLVGLLPGLGSANMVALVPKFWADHSDSRKYLASISAINAADTLFGIASLYLIERSRSGASIAIQKLLSTLSIESLLILAFAVLAAGSFARWLSLSFAGRIVKVVKALNHRGLTLSVLAFISTLVCLTTGFWGFIILTGTSLLGMVAPLANVRRAQAMGLFLVPTMLFFSGEQAWVVTKLGIQAINSSSLSTSPGEVLYKLALSMAIAFGIYWLISRRVVNKRDHCKVSYNSSQERL